MKLDELTAISPLDGRYRKRIEALSKFFSESALIQYRIQVEIEYFIELLNHKSTQIHPLNPDQIALLRSIYLNFSLDQARRVKEIEQRTNHDVKAVEYFIKEQLEKLGVNGLSQKQEFVHFGLTSQDVNNTAIPLMIRDALQEVILPRLRSLTEYVLELGDNWKEVPMLARTHGQPATPTTVGKEIHVFAKRLMLQLAELEDISIPAKFGGATGNLNAHYVSFPSIDWDTFADEFVEKKLGLSRSFPTTQIDHYDGLSRIFDCFCRLNSILVDLCQDMWLYISQEYFLQRIRKDEVGSSAMPHKVNPIDFENAEGNAALSSAILGFLSRKLPVSRLQRDLTDSTLLRNIGTGISHFYLALSSVSRGLGKLQINEAIIQADLNHNWAILAEAIQTVLRKEGYPQPYEALKALTRGKSVIDQTHLQNFIRALDVSAEVKAQLLELRPDTYIGNAGG
ncbi:MAG: adenylosuccinate lyase [Bacteroidota bacterium]